MTKRHPRNVSQKLNNSMAYGSGHYMRHVYILRDSTGIYIYMYLCSSNTHSIYNHSISNDDLASGVT